MLLTQAAAKLVNADDFASFGKLAFQLLCTAIRHAECARLQATLLDRWHAPMLPSKLPHTSIRTDLQPKAAVRCAIFR